MPRMDRITSKIMDTDMRTGMGRTSVRRMGWNGCGRLRWRTSRRRYCKVSCRIASSGIARLGLLLGGRRGGARGIRVKCPWSFGCRRRDDSHANAA